MIEEKKTEEKKIKSLANCKPTEFARQTNKIRHYVEKWVKLTQVGEIRKHLPEIPEGATEEEKNALIKEQNFKNFSEMLDKALDEHPEETIGVLAMCCFIPPEKADEQPIDLYFEVLSDLIESKAVTRFFISLAKLGLRVGT